MLTFKCSACKKKIVIDDNLSGQQGECPYCRKVVLAPGTPKTASVSGGTGADKRKVMLLGVLLVVALLVAAFMFRGGDAAPEFPVDEMCRRRMLGVLDNAWIVPGGTPQSQGSQFWLDVGQKRNIMAALKCPGGANKTRRYDYRGPGKAFAELHENDIVMVCEKGNHPDGVNVLYRSGSVVWAAQDSDIYKKALAESKE